MYVNVVRGLEYLRDHPSINAPVFLQTIGQLLLLLLPL